MAEPYEGPWQLPDEYNANTSMAEAEAWQEKIMLGYQRQLFAVHSHIFGYRSVPGPITRTGTGTVSFLLLCCVNVSCLHRVSFELKPACSQSSQALV